MLFRLRHIIICKTAIVLMITIITGYHPLSTAQPVSKIEFSLKEKKTIITEKKLASTQSPITLNNQELSITNCDITGKLMFKLAGKSTLRLCKNRMKESSVQIYTDDASESHVQVDSNSFYSDIGEHYCLLIKGNGFTNLIIKYNSMEECDFGIGISDASGEIYQNTYTGKRGNNGEAGKQAIFLINGNRQKNGVETIIDHNTILNFLTGIEVENNEGVVIDNNLLDNLHFTDPSNNSIIVPGNKVAIKVKNSPKAVVSNNILHNNNQIPTSAMVSNGNYFRGIWLEGAMEDATVLSNHIQKYGEGIHFENIQITPPNETFVLNCNLMTCNYNAWVFNNSNIGPQGTPSTANDPGISHGNLFDYDNCGGLLSNNVITGSSLTGPAMEFYGYGTTGNSGSFEWPTNSLIVPNPSQVSWLSSIPPFNTSMTENCEALGMRERPEETIKPISIYSLEKIIYFPNPASDVITFIIPKSLLHAEIKMFDITGKEIISQILSPGNNSVSINFMSKGVYHFRIFNNEAVLEKGNIVKN